MRQAIGLLGAMLLSATTPIAAEEALTASGPQGDLAGTLLQPAPQAPLVLVIPGSGPTDRDGNNPLGVTSASYRLLAEALAERGIGTLRIDKRGMFGSKNAVADANAVTIADYVDDVAAWVARAREATDAECIWLLGHSEGGLVALAATRAVENLCGLVLVASPGRRMADVIRAQLRANPANAPVLDDALSALDRLEQGERVDVSAMHPALQGLFAPQVQGFLIDAMRYDPASLASEVDLPMLIVQGGKDLQVSAEGDGAALHAAQPGADYVVLPQMNHVLKDVESEDAAANIATYRDASIPIAGELVDVLVGFLTKTEADKD